MLVVEPSGESDLFAHHLHNRYGEIHEHSHGKTSKGQDAAQAERTVGTMLAVVEEGSSVQAPNGAG